MPTDLIALQQKILKPKTWTFEQLVGNPRLPLTLSGWAAPFGRPRKGAIVNMGLSIRHTTTYYPGNSSSPTVHEFGTMGKPFELHGRWMDSAHPYDGAAKDRVRQWKDFIADACEVRAKWGDILSYRVFLHDFDAEVESEAEVAWKLQGVVLVDEADPVNIIALQANPSPADYAGDMFAKMKLVLKPFQTPSLSDLLNILPEIADYASALITSLNAPFSAIVDTLSAISDFETALSSDLSKMLAGMQGVRSGLLELRDTNEMFVSRVMMLNRQAVALLPGGSLVGGLFSGPDILTLTSQKASADTATTNLLALMADLRSTIEGSWLGLMGSAHAAQDGDSWESISVRKLGSATGARSIKNVNAIRYSQKPQPGRSYGIPRTP